MKMPSRKSERVETNAQKIAPYLMYLILFVTFAFANIFYTRGQLAVLPLLMQNYGLSNSLGQGISAYVIYLVVVSFVSVIALEVVMTVYYFLAFQFMKGLMPFSITEFKVNLRPFMVLRNLIWGVLSLLFFVRGGYFIGVGLLFFEALSTMIVFFPCFFYFKNKYIANGFSARTLLAFAVPFMILNLITIVSNFRLGV